VSSGCTADRRRRRSERPGRPVSLPVADIRRGFPLTEGTAAPGRAAPFPEGARRSAHRRRPTGEAPPLPRHIERTGVGWLVGGCALIVLALFLLMAGRWGRGLAVTTADVAILDRLQFLRTWPGEPVLRAVAVLGYWQVLKAIGIGVLITLLVTRRFRHLIVMWVSLNIANGLAIALSAMVRRPRPLGISQAGPWSGFSLPSRPVMFLAGFSIAVLYTLVPKGPLRQAGKVVAAVAITALALARMGLGLDAPSDVLIGVAIGVTVPLVAFRLFCPTAVFPVTYARRTGNAAHLDVGGARGEAIRRAVSDQLGLEVLEVKPFGLSGSAGSTPLRITVAGSDGGPPVRLFGKLYARSHLRSDRWYKVFRELLYGRLEDEKSFNTVRRLVQQEDYALHKLHAAGLPVPRPYGFVELTPDREYMLVSEFVEGSVELGEAEVDESVIDQGLTLIRHLWRAGLAHRDIKPANLLVRDGRMMLIDVAFVEMRPSPWRQAVDLANMMLCLALRSSPELVYERALRQFSVQEISEGFAATRGLAMPSQLRRMLREQGRDAHERFLELLPERPKPISIQRWTTRRVLLLGTTALALFLLVITFVPFAARDDRLNTSIEAGAGCTDLEPLWLIAQSVPTATQVPCVPALPAGLSLNDVRVSDAGTTMRFTRIAEDTRSEAIVARLVRTCDTSGATRVAGDEPAATLWERAEPVPPRSGIRPAVVRSYVFPGGCLVVRYKPAAGPVQPVDEAAVALDLTPRERLARVLDEHSQGRLRLDPEVDP
jgi:tRNA A-37 threonylcarbamoyl transferase component Bud32